MTEDQKINDKFKAAEVIAAIEGTRGIYSVIASKLGCTSSTVRRYIKNYATVKEAYDAERGMWIDQAESVILQAMNERDIPTAKWVLSRQGKDRGWAERTEVTGADGSALTVRTLGEFLSNDDSDQTEGE